MPVPRAQMEQPLVPPWLALLWAGCVARPCMSPGILLEAPPRHLQDLPLPSPAVQIFAARRCWLVNCLARRLATARPALCPPKHTWNRGILRLGSAAAATVGPGAPFLRLLPGAGIER